MYKNLTLDELLRMSPREEVFDGLLAKLAEISRNQSNMEAADVAAYDCGESLHKSDRN